jgi:thioredoxin reductase (NADPH)
MIIMERACRTAGCATAFFSETKRWWSSAAGIRLPKNRSTWPNWPKKVYLVHRRDELRAGALLQQRVQADCDIEILWNTVVTEIRANAEGVSAVQLEDTQNGKQRQLNTDGVFIFIGFDPNNKLVPAGTKMNADGYVVTDDKCGTTTPGIYVIGDLREKYARQIVLSAADGCTAALAAAHFVETRKASDSCELPADLQNLAS